MGIEKLMLNELKIKYESILDTYHQNGTGYSEQNTKNLKELYIPVSHLMEFIDDTFKKYNLESSKLYSVIKKELGEKK